MQHLLARVVAAASRPRAGWLVVGTLGLALAGCSGERHFGSGAGGEGSASTSATGSEDPGSIAQGEACSSNSACKSGSCVDGVCCGSPCDAECMACAEHLTGEPDGVCAPAYAATDPHGECAAQDPTTCGRRGGCDGAGACGLHPAGVACSAPTCAGGVKTLAKVCDGEGSCAANGTESCATGKCDGDVCPGQCASNDQCATGYCDVVSGDCVTKLDPGAACVSAEQCQSGFCTDGVCCNSACSGVCETCAAAKGASADGVCSPAASGADPDNECADQGSASCKSNGSCDGARACAFYPNGTVCAAATCSGSDLVGAKTCNGAGQCGGGGSEPCPYGCSGAACVGGCTDTSCASSQYCSSGVCVAKLGNGSTCSAAKQCSSGSCVDGVCCSSACSGTCQACSVAAGAPSNGTCSNLTANTDPAGECADQGGSSCGTTGMCNGAGACAVYSGNTCAGPTCSGNSVVAARTCSGGSCSGGGATTSCGAYSCSGGACNSPCTTNSHCVSPNVCVSGVCKPEPPRANGVACSSGGQCQSGFCADGVCCNTQCSGQCKTCDGSGWGGEAAGTCGNSEIDLSCPSNCCSPSGVCAQMCL